MNKKVEALQAQGISRRQFLTIGAASAGAVGIAALSGPVQSAGATTSSAQRILRVGWTTPPDLLNPFTFTSSASFEIVSLMYDTLLEYDVNLKSSAGLAQSHTVSADGKTFTYKLRSNATWHDGKPVTAADVKFTFDTTAKNNLGQAAWSLGEYLSSRVVDTHTVAITYKKPQAFDPALAVFIVPQHIWGSMSSSQIQSNTNPKPVGSGPYRFKKWATGQYVQVVRNASWWGVAPHAAGIIWNEFANADVMTQSLASGSVDILTEVPAVLWNGLKSKPGVKAAEMESFSFHHIGFNVSKAKTSKGNPLLLDKTVRQALSYSLNRAQLVALALAGHGLPGSVQLPPSFGDWHENIPKNQRFDNNPAKAKKILAKAGYKVGSNGIRVDKHGKPLQFRLIVIQTTDEDVLAGQIFVKAAKAVGISLTLETLDSTTLGNIVYNSAAPDWDIFIWGWDANNPDPDYLLSIDLTSQIGGNNDVFYSNPAYDALYAQQAVAMNRTERINLVHQAQKMFYEDAAYCVMWYQSKVQAYRTDTWQGWKEIRGGAVYNFTRSNYLTVKPK